MGGCMMSPLELLQDVKIYLGVTWQDPTTDQRLTGLIASGVAYINSKYGKAADYSVDGFPRTLLFEYVRYARDAALDVFENNYTALILAMQNEKRVSEYEGVSDTEPDV